MIQIILFPKMKISVKRKRFNSTEDILANTQEVLNICKKGYFQKWKHCVVNQKITMLGEIHRNSLYVLSFLSIKIF